MFFRFHIHKNSINTKNHIPYSFIWNTFFFCYENILICWKGICAWQKYVQLCPTYWICKKKKIETKRIDVIARNRKKMKPTLNFISFTCYIIILLNLVRNRKKYKMNKKKNFYYDFNSNFLLGFITKQDCGDSENAV